MARAALSWSGHELAAKAGLGYATVARFEAGGAMASATLDAIEAAFASAGIAFTQSSGRIGVTAPH